MHGLVTDKLQELIDGAYGLALEAGNELLPQSVRQTYSEEIDTILGEVIRLANMGVDNYYLFGGHQTDTPAFTANLVAGTIVSVDYNGNGGQREVEISDGSGGALLGCIGHWLMFSEYTVRVNAVNVTCLNNSTDLPSRDEELSAISYQLSAISFRVVTHGWVGELIADG